MSRVCVWPHPLVDGWDGVTDEYISWPVVDLNDALNGEFPGDFHYTLGVLKGYSEQPRLSKEGLPRYIEPVLFSAVVIDIDTPGKKTASEDDVAAFVSGVIERLKDSPLYPTMGWYRSRGGVHLVWELPDTSLPRWLEIHAQVREHLGALGIQYDDLKDWGRCYRAPHATRDGVLLRLPKDLSRLGALPVEALGPAESLAERAAKIAAAKSVGGFEVDAVIPDGHRNTTLMRIAGSLRRIGMGKEEIAEALDAVNQRRCSPPLDTEEIEKLADSAVRYPVEASAFPVVDLETGAVTQSCDRPTLIVNMGKDHEAAAEAEKILVAKKGLLYRRGEDLVQVMPSDGSVLAMSRVPLARILGEEIAWRGLKRRTGKGEEGYDEIPINPPDRVVDMVLTSGRVQLPELRAVIRVPTLRPDGSVISSPGYDDATAVYFHPDGCNVPPVPDQPTKADARAALDKLAYLVADYPFEKPAHRSVALACLMTPLVRPAISGPIPMFMIDSPTPGAAKTKLVHLASILCTGRFSSLRPYQGDEELTKALPAMLGGREPEPIVCFDNVDRPIGGSTMDALLTATKIKPRILGRSEEAELENRAVWCSTGVNLTLLGDSSRRALRCRISPPEERPEMRSDFREQDLEGYTMFHRGELISAVLTVLRAYCIAGRPSVGLGVMGSYVGWSSLIRSALVWLGEADPVDTQAELREVSDDSLGYVEQVLGACYNLRGEAPLLAREICSLAAGGAGMGMEGSLNDCRDLKEGLEALLGEDVKVTSYSVARLLSRLVGRNLGGLRFVRCEVPRREGQKWRVERLSKKLDNVFPIHGTVV